MLRQAFIFTSVSIFSVIFLCVLAALYLLKVFEIPILIISKLNEGPNRKASTSRDNNIIQFPSVDTKSQNKNMNSTKGAAWKI